MADVISSGVKTTSAERTGAGAPDVAGIGAPEVTGSVGAVGGDVDMTEPETSDTKLVGSTSLPGLGRRL